MQSSPQNTHMTASKKTEDAKSNGPSCRKVPSDARKPLQQNNGCISKPVQFRLHKAVFNQENIPPNDTAGADIHAEKSSQCLALSSKKSGGRSDPSQRAIHITPFTGTGDDPGSLSSLEKEHSQTENNNASRDTPKTETRQSRKSSGNVKQHPVRRRLVLQPQSHNSQKKVQKGIEFQCKLRDAHTAAENLYELNNELRVSNHKQHTFF